MIITHKRSGIKRVGRVVVCNVCLCLPKVCVGKLLGSYMDVKSRSCHYVIKISVIVEVHLVLTFKSFGCLCGN